MSASLNALLPAPGPTVTPAPSVSAGSGSGPTYVTYGVAAGDTLFSIALMFSVQESDIRALNPQITDWGNLLPGTILNIPRDTCASIPGNGSGKINAAPVKNAATARPLRRAPPKTARKTTVGTITQPKAASRPMRR